jgi:hypothetical protein
MSHRSENGIHSDIFFNVQPRLSKMTTSSDVSLPAPTVFTGRPLRGTLVISHDKRQEHVFDVVQLTLQGIEYEIAYIDSERLIINF